MPACHNQKYKVYKENWRSIKNVEDIPENFGIHGTSNYREKYSRLFNAYGCAACCVAHVSEYYNNEVIGDEYLEEYLEKCGVIDIYDKTTKWYRCPYGNIGNEIRINNDIEFFKDMRYEISNDRPVIVKQKVNGGYHFVVVFAYSNNGDKDEDFEVLDSANYREGDVIRVAHPEIKNKTMAVTNMSKGKIHSLKKSLTDNYGEYYYAYRKTSMRNHQI